MSCPYTAGQQVVCIADAEGWCQTNLKRPTREVFPGIIIPQKNSVYTIRQILACDDDYVGLLFQEIRNKPYPCLNGLEEPNWDWRAFKPLETKEDKLEIFRKMLTGNTAPKEIEKKVTPKVREKENVN
jgi:hypothetical protein